MLHVDETPVAMLEPGNKKALKTYIWRYCTTTFNPTKAVVFNFAETGSGEHVRDFLGLQGATPWQGNFVTDAFSLRLRACFDAPTGKPYTCRPHEKHDNPVMSASPRNGPTD